MDHFLVQPFKMETRLLTTQLCYSYVTDSQHKIKNCTELGYQFPHELCTFLLFLYNLMKVF